MMRPLPEIPCSPLDLHTSREALPKCDSSNMPRHLMGTKTSLATSKCDFFKHAPPLNENKNKPGHFLKQARAVPKPRWSRNRALPRSGSTTSAASEIPASRLPSSMRQVSDLGQEGLGRTGVLPPCYRFQTLARKAWVGQECWGPDSSLTVPDQVKPLPTLSMGLPAAVSG